MEAFKFESPVELKKSDKETEEMTTDKKELTQEEVDAAKASKKPEGDMKPDGKKPEDEEEAAKAKEKSKEDAASEDEGKKPEDEEDKKGSKKSEDDDLKSFLKGLQTTLSEVTTQIADLRKSVDSSTAKTAELESGLNDVRKIAKSADEALSGLANADPNSDRASAKKSEKKEEYRPLGDTAFQRVD